MGSYIVINISKYVLKARMVTLRYPGLGPRGVFMHRVVSCPVETIVMHMEIFTSMRICTELTGIVNTTQEL